MENCIVDVNSLSIGSKINCLRTSRALLQYFYDNTDIITRKDLSLSFIALDHVISFLVQNANLTFDD